MGVKVKVLLKEQGSPAAGLDAVDVYCGAGHQILRWLGHAACAQLAQRMGLPMGCQVPKAILDRDGRVMDVDLMLSEALSAEGAVVTVEYGAGPCAWTTRWEGRPRTPSFQWDEAANAEATPPHDAWLSALDLSKEGLAALQNPEARLSAPAEAAADLRAVKQLLVAHAGLLQALLLVHTCEGATTTQALLCQMSLPQFRAMMAAGQVVTQHLPADKLDDIFAAAATSEQALARRGNSSSSASWLTLPDLMVALVHVAHQRYLAEASLLGLAPNTPLAAQVAALIHDNLVPHLQSALQRRLDKLAGAATPGAVALLAKGARLTEHAFEQCQMKRGRANVRSGALLVELAAVISRLEDWQRMKVADSGAALVWALQGRSTEPGRFELLEDPLMVGCPAFESLLLALAWGKYQGRAMQRRQAEPWEDFLADQLSSVYRKSGVLITATGNPSSGGADGGSTARSSRGTTARLTSPTLVTGLGAVGYPPSSARQHGSGAGGAQEGAADEQGDARQPAMADSNASAPLVAV